LILDSGITVAALVAVNSNGSAINPSSGHPWEISLEMGKEFGHPGRRAVKLPPLPKTGPARNTTLGLVATDAVLSKTQAQKVAQMAQDGLARAIRPAHTMFDGDIVFCLATGKRQLPEVMGSFTGSHAQAINQIGQAAADCMSRAIIHSLLTAHSLADMTGSLAFLMGNKNFPLTNT
jgi:L-aminopeptidase/D-esterase-like protein